MVRTIRFSLFQSTLPVRGATLVDDVRPVRAGISIHAPRKGSDLMGGEPQLVQLQFQSTLPVRGATWMPRTEFSSPLFQSTLPVRGATRALRFVGVKGIISIHAPRKGSDCTPNLSVRTIATFQSTLPVRGATPWIASRIRMMGISIHAPRKGSDSRLPVRRRRQSDFNPRSP